MLRRVARVLRIVLFPGGLFLLVLLPASFCYVAYVKLSWGPSTVFLADGAISVNTQSGHSDQTIAFGVDRFPWQLHGYWGPVYFVPKVLWEPRGLSGYYGVMVPLWLLAFLSLAWPVTSWFIARRRRRGRGFEVEARGTSNIEHIEHRKSNIELPEIADPEPQRRGASQSPGHRPG